MRELEKQVPPTGSRPLKFSRNNALLFNSETTHLAQTTHLIVPHNNGELYCPLLCNVLALENEQGNEYYHLKMSSKRSNSIGP